MVSVGIHDRVQGHEVRQPQARRHKGAPQAQPGIILIEPQLSEPAVQIGQVTGGVDPPHVHGADDGKLVIRERRTRAEAGDHAGVEPGGHQYSQSARCGRGSG
jgi:hypothetical protein